MTEQPMESWSEAPPAGRPDSPLARLMDRLLAATGNPPVTLVLWNGVEVTSPGRLPVARIRINDRAALFSLLLDHQFQFGELYSAGRLQIEGDLVACLEALYRANPGSGGWLDRMGIRRRRLNTLSGSRENIHRHYNLGNDFYRLWLDQRMLYTCAYFPDGSETLEAAQIAKMEHVCRKLWLKPGERVVEAGCGWGGLAMHMARHYGVTVKAYNISQEQLAYARQAAQQEGLQDRVEFIEDDYRNIRGEFDAFVSVGMLEHVGPENYPALGKIIARCLKPEGRGLIHTIGRNQPRPMHVWIEKRIFPGACPPSLRQMMDIFEPSGFSVLDVENLRRHYSKTLEHWLARFDAAESTIAGLYGENFVRAWRLYLAGSTAAFTTGDLQLFQITFAPGQSNDIPWNRQYLYRDAPLGNL